MAAGVLGAMGAGITLVFSLLMVLFGGILSVVSSPSGNSVAGSGLLLFLLGAAAVGVSATFFILPWVKGPVVGLAILTAGILWAFARIDAVPFAVLAVIPLCFAILCGLAAGVKSADRANG